nr:hypothetical protein GCM10020063_042840 [Dactylosporangium thailandense]
MLLQDAAAQTQRRGGAAAGALERAAGRSPAQGPGPSRWAPIPQLRLAARQRIGRALGCSA